MIKRGLVVLFLFKNLALYGNNYYVATNGSDSNPGTISQPFATWQKGVDVASAGDIVYIRGGVYYTSGILQSTGYCGVFIENKNGTSSNRISIVAYQGEYPILDCSNMTQGSEINFGISIESSSYLYLKGLQIRNVPAASGYTAAGISTYHLNHCTLERITSNGNQGPGIGIDGDDNLLIYCDAYDNYDVQLGGENADGFIFGQCISRNTNTLKDCRSWHNSDDGFDSFGNEGTIIYSRCWSFNNGYGSAGDGDGFKLGATHLTPLSTPQKVLTNCLAANNKGIGFDQSEGNVLINLYNNTSYNNSRGFEFSNGGNLALNFENNISYSNSNPDNFQSLMIRSNNSWQDGHVVTDEDFVTVSDAGIDGSRNSDGTLPSISFLHLASGSDLIDAGTNVGLAYNGNAPDLGYFESGSTSTATVPQYVSSVIQNSTPSLLEISFDNTLASTVPSASAFTVNVNSSARSINSVVVSGSKVTLTLSSSISYSDVVTISYTKPSSNSLKSTSGGEAASFTNKSVTNNLSGAIPSYVSSVIRNESPAWLEMTYNMSLANILPSVSAFTVTVNSVAVSIRYVLISDTKVCLALTNSVSYGDVITVSYTKPAANPVQTSSGTQANSFTAQKVTNSVAAIPAPVYVSSVVQNATPSKLDITFSLALGTNVPATSAFTVMVNSAARSVSSVTVSGTVVTLTLASAVVYSNTVTVAYTKPSSSPLQTTAGGQVASFYAQVVTNNVASTGTVPTPAYVISSVENATPSKINIVYNLSLANTVPATSAFAVSVNSTARTVSSVTVSGTTVVLTLSSPVAHGDAVKVAYTKPSSNPLQTSAGGQAATFSAQTVTNNVQVSNSAPVVMVNYKSTTYSGFVNEINASGSYDPNKDNLTFSWVVPSNISVSSTTGSTIQYLSPVADATQNVQFVVNVSDGKTTQSKTIPIQILPYELGLEVAEVAKVEASSYLSPNYPSNIIDGNIGTMWASNGDNEWLLLELKTAFSVQHVDLAFQPGQKRESFFDILGSEDMTTWETILSKSYSCAFSGALQVFDFPSSKTDKEFKYIKVIGHGNATDAWNYISEFRIFGYKHKNPTSYEEQPVKIYPNPAKNYFNVRIDETSVVNDFLRIVSLTGKILFQEKIDPGVSEFRVPINLLKGIYLIQMGAGNLTLFSQKLVVSN